MLDNHFKRPAILQRHRAGVLGTHLDSHTSMLKAIGCPVMSARRNSYLLRCFALWVRAVVGTAARILLSHLRELGVVGPAAAVAEPTALEALVRR